MSLLAKLQIGCTHYSLRDCPVPGFSGSDSSPAYSPSNSALFVGSYDNNIYKINGTRPFSVLSKNHGSGGEDSPKLHESTNTYVAWGNLRGDTLDCYNMVTDEMLWQFKPKEKGITTSGVYYDYAFVGTSDSDKGVLYAVDMLSGKEVWSRQLEGEIWGTLGPGFYSDEVSDVDLVCLGVGGNANPFKDTESSIQCMDIHTGVTAWSASVGKQIQSRPSFGKSSLFVGDYNGCMYSFDVHTGAKVWEHCFGKYLSNVEGSSAVLTLSDGTEYVLVDSFTGYLYALHGSTGDEVWKTKLGNPHWMGGGAASSVRVVGNKAYVGGPTGVWSVDAETGEVLWKYEVGTQCGSSPVVYNGIVAIACEDGYMYLLEA